MNGSAQTIKHYLLTMGLIAIFIAGVSFTNSSASASEAEKDTADKELALKTTEKFYSDYLKYINQNGDADKLIDYLKKRADVDDKFVKELDKMITEASESSEAGLGYDPILMGQDLPEKMKFETPVIKGAEAELIVQRVFGDDSSPLCVLLNKSAGAWRICGVIDMNDEDNSRDCGGMAKKTQ